MDRVQFRFFTRLLIAIAITCVVSSDTIIAAEPQWIWGTEKSNESVIDGLCLFRKTFELSDLPDSAILQITCDDQYVIRINNRLVGVDENLSTIEQYDVASILKKGENTIFVRARNMAKGPAGLVAHLKLQMSDGQVREIMTDTSWQASIQKSGTWNPDVLKVKSWKAAHSAGDLKSASPWKELVKLDENLRVVSSSRRSQGPFELKDGDRVLFLGNTVIEREQRYGYWEAALTTRYPDRNIVFRNLGWSGDTVFGEARARFGSQRDGFDHLEVHVHAVRPTVIICGYGSNAVFAGQEGLDAFVAGYEKLLDALETTGATIVLMAPLKHEQFGGKYLSPEYNENREYYAKVIKLLAKGRGCGYFELDQSNTDELTDNGVHLTELGYASTAELVEQALGLPKRDAIEINVAAGSVTANGATIENVKVGDSIEFDLSAAMLSPCPSSTTVSAAGGQKHIKFSGLETGEYEVVVEGKPQATLTSDDLAAGIALEAIDSQIEELVTAIRKKNELYFHRWRPQNETYLFLFRKHEQGNNAVEIPKFDPLVADVEKEIAELRRPRALKLELRTK